MSTKNTMRLILAAGAMLVPAVAFATPQELNQLLDERVQALRQQIEAVTPASGTRAQRAEHRTRRRNLLYCLTDIQRLARDVIAGSDSQTFEQVIAMTDSNPALCRRSVTRARAIRLGLTRPTAFTPEVAAVGSADAAQRREGAQIVEQAAASGAAADESPAQPPTTFDMDFTTPETAEAPRSPWPVNAAEVEQVVAQLGGQVTQRGNASLTQEEMESFFNGFEIGYQGGQRPKVTLYGRGPAVCMAAFEVENSAQMIEGRRLMGTASDGTPVAGVRVLDPTGAGRSCIEAVRAAAGGTLRCETNETRLARRGSEVVRVPNPLYCRSLRELPGAADIDFSNVPSGRIGLIYMNPDSDRAGNAGVALHAAQHVSRADYENQVRADGIARRREQIERLAGIARGCNDESVDRRRAAVTALSRMNAREVRSVIHGFNARDLLKEISRAQLDEIIAEIRNADLDELADIRERLLAYLENNPDDATRIRNAYERIVNRYAVLSRNNNPEALEHAQAAMEELAATGAYEGATLERIQNVAFGFQMAGLQRQASMPNAMYNMSLWNTWGDLYQQAFQNWSECNFGGGGMMMGGGFFGGGAASPFGASQSMEGCVSAAERFQNIASLPQYAGQAQQQRQRMYTEMQQRFQQFSGGAMGGLGNGMMGGPQYFGGSPTGSFSGGAFGNPNITL